MENSTRSHPVHPGLAYLLLKRRINPWASGEMPASSPRTHVCGSQMCEHLLCVGAGPAARTRQAHAQGLPWRGHSVLGGHTAGAETTGALEPSMKPPEAFCQRGHQGEVEAPGQGGGCCSSSGTCAFPENKNAAHSMWRTLVVYTAHAQPDSPGCPADPLRWVFWSQQTHECRSQGEGAPEHFCELSQHSCEAGMIISILQIGKLRFRQLEGCDHCLCPCCSTPRWSPQTPPAFPRGFAWHVLLS